MHLRGKACKYEVTRADGKTTTLLDIPRYDFNWQLLYRYFEPLSLKAGESIRFTAWYDNSDKNPANPDPTKTVRWGAQTFDEMHLGYVEYYIPGAKPGESPSLYGGRRRAGGGARPGFDVEAIFKRLDRNNDGKLIGDEIPEAQRENLMRLDTNQDGAITLEEAKRIKS
jgi:Ca2+-binding EF-hand superfamily protein